MGLLKVGINAARDVLADSWRDYFYCDSMGGDILASRALKKTDRGNKKGNPNVISNGSIIVVNEGQCMMLVEQGKIVEFSAEAGEFVYDESSEPSLFYGNLSQTISQTIDQFMKRVSFGGEAGTDQRVYFFNTKEIMGNKYGTANPVPFRVVDKNIGLDVDISIRAHGEYSYHICDPILFYKNVCGNVAGSFRKEELDSQLKSELLTALQPALSKISAMGIRYSEVPGHTFELADALNEVLTEKWRNTRGIEIVNFGMNSISASKEDEDMIKQLQRNAVYRDPSMAAATLTGAQAQAMQDAAKNTATGPMIAFQNMNAAANAGGVNAGALYNMAAQNMMQQNMAQQNMNASSNVNNTNVQMRAQNANSWTCSCGQVNDGNFCQNCGNKRPDASWTCSCGQVNTGNFCSNCGNKRA